MKVDQIPSGFEAMQQMFEGFTSMPGAKGPDWANYWRNQDKILDSMQEFAAGWFERRHQATRAAFDAASRASGAKSPVDFAREYQTWLTGSMQRVVADCMACQKHLATVAQLSAPSARGEEQAPVPPSKPSDLGKGERAKAA